VHPLLLHIASGWVFWDGIGLLAAAVLLGINAKGKFRRHLSLTAALFGILGWLLSSTPTPGWLFWPTMLSAAAMECALQLRYAKTWIFQTALALCLAAAAMIELPHWREAEAVPVKGTLWILADSISSGIGFDGEMIWSRLLEAKHPGRIQNRAVRGGEVISALPILRKHFAFRPGDALLIELGGNDMFHGVPAETFREKLDELLAAVAATGVPTVMLELPTPPFHSAYLRVQRELAEQYGVKLVPRRRFAAVLSGNESTADGLHLSNFGHKKMAAEIQRHFIFE
jgi:acyl-CoA thioesterase-1